MFGWHQTGVLPIGVEIGGLSIRMLQLRAAKGGLSLVAARCAEITPAEAEDSPGRSGAVTETLRKLLTGGGFSGWRCVTALNPTLLHAKSLRLPQMPESELAQAVQWEARDRLGFDLAEGRMVHFRAGEVRRGNELKDEVLVFAATQEVLRGHIAQLSGAGLALHAIDLSPAAMLRAVHRVRPELPGSVTTVVDLGTGGTQLAISQEGRLMFYKYIEIGSRMMDDAVASKLGVAHGEAAQIRAGLTERGAAGDGGTEAGGHADPHLTQAVNDALRPVLEELARELDMCVRYYVVTFRGTRPECMQLVGGHGGAHVRAFLAEALGMAIEPSEPLRGVNHLTAGAPAERSAEWAVAAGLSLYGLAEKQLEAAA